MTEAALRSRLADIRCFVLDMDGTIYLGDRLFPFTKTFLEKAAGAGGGTLIRSQFLRSQ